ncbi:MAG: hypothetical protein FJZ58_06045 [Chlamydiae bacterium]|nr:hypothetical protein [Chlamydiota bacterium]
MNQLPLNPWLSMWRHPRKTVRSLIENKVSYGFFSISLICGLPLSFQTVSIFSLAAGMPLIGALFLVLLLAPVFGMIWLTLMSAMLFWTGKLFRGKASFLETRCALTWSYLVNLLMILGFFLYVVCFGLLAFNGGVKASDIQGIELLTFHFSYWLNMLGFFYMLVLLVASLAEAQKFSIGKAVANCIAAFLLFFVFIAVMIWALGIV